MRMTISIGLWAVLWIWATVTSPRGKAWHAFPGVIQNTVNSHDALPVPVSQAMR